MSDLGQSERATQERVTTLFTAQPIQYPKGVSVDPEPGHKKAAGGSPGGSLGGDHLKARG